MRYAAGWSKLNPELEERFHIYSDRLYRQRTMQRCRHPLSRARFMARRC